MLVKNLINNAIRYGGERRCRVDVSVQRRDGHAEIVVVHDGPGIPVVERARVIDRLPGQREGRGGQRARTGDRPDRRREPRRQHHAFRPDRW